MLRWTSVVIWDCKNIGHLDCASLEAMITGKINIAEARRELAQRELYQICWDCRNEIYVFSTEGVGEIHAAPCRCTVT